VRVLFNEPLLARNTLAVKASAVAYVSATSERELMEALAWAAEHHKSVITLGQGSNVVLAGDLDALVIHQAQRGIDVLEETGNAVVLRVAAGENWHALVGWTLAQGYYGLENLALIPGTVGAAPIQNIGAYGVELAAFVRRVNGVQIDTMQAVTRSVDECEFSYRDSIFKRALRDKFYITSVELVLSREPNLQLSYPTLKNYLAATDVEGELTPGDVFDAVVSIRQSRLPDPAVIPNVGSFFKNPVLSEQQLADILELAPNLPCYPQSDGRSKIPAAWLIDKCGWKGKRVGEVGVHHEHALVLANYGGGTGRQILALADEIARSVFSTYAIALEIEPRVYGA